MYIRGPKEGYLPYELCTTLRFKHFSKLAMNVISMRYVHVAMNVISMRYVHVEINA
jgi:hypothetical protein